jgi:glutamine amidotransferase
MSSAQEKAEDSRIVMIDYGMGNLQSIYNAFEAIGEKVHITDKPGELASASAIILPGVGAFSDGMRNLRQSGMVDALNEEVGVRGKPYFGICLGMQFLALKSHEDGLHDGLGWIDGVVKRIEPTDKQVKVPHMGWNDVAVVRKDGLFAGLEDNPVFYFVHSYHLEVENGSSHVVTSTCQHGITITASVQKDNIFGVQFHPEKSQQAGLAVLRSFRDMVKGNA